MTSEHVKQEFSTDDFPSGFRIDVIPAFSGPALRSTWAAQLLEKDDRGRWHKKSLAVLNDEGPIAAISDLLSLLDLGKLVFLMSEHVKQSEGREEGQQRHLEGGWDERTNREK